MGSNKLNKDQKEWQSNLQSTSITLGFTNILLCILTAYKNKLFYINSQTFSLIMFLECIFYVIGTCIIKYKNKDDSWKVLVKNALKMTIVLIILSILLFIIIWSNRK